MRFLGFDLVFKEIDETDTDIDPVSSLKSLQLLLEQVTHHLTPKVGDHEFITVEDLCHEYLDSHVAVTWKREDLFTEIGFSCCDSVRHWSEVKWQNETELKEDR